MFSFLCTSHFRRYDLENTETAQSSSHSPQSPLVFIAQPLHFALNLQSTCRLLRSTHPSSSQLSTPSCISPPPLQFNFSSPWFTLPSAARLTIYGSPTPPRNVSSTTPDFRSLSC